MRLARATEFRDDDTGAHVQSLSDYAKILGEALGMSAEECDILRWAAMLHDVGKRAIPDDILLKPGKLTPEEYEVMKTHTSSGAAMLAGSDHALLQLAERIALTHHERWGGSGYPNGLAGEDIPIEGRICAICDVFDALTSERPYKKAWSFEDAFAEIQRCGGTHFDPVLVDLFVARKNRISDIFSLLGQAADQDELADAAQESPPHLQDGKGLRDGAI